MQKKIQPDHLWDLHQERIEKAGKTCRVEMRAPVTRIAVMAGIETAEHAVQLAWYLFSFTITKKIVKWEEKKKRDWSLSLPILKLYFHASINGIKFVKLALKNGIVYFLKSYITNFESLFLMSYQYLKEANKTIWWNCDTLKFAPI